jgi:hypothetical protein
MTRGLVREGNMMPDSSKIMSAEFEFEFEVDKV